MADSSEETSPPSRAGGGSGLNRKLGPLPMWVWAVGLGGVAGLVWFWRRGQNASTAAADSAAAGSGDTTPTSLVPINEGLSESQYEALLDAIKKLQGPPSDDKPPPTTLPGKLPPGPGDMTWPKPTPAPKPRPAPKTVTVVPWTRDHTPWNSTLWGIATHEHVKGGWQYLAKINHIRDPRKDLHPGMKIKLSQ